mmetsp:Transcript_13157/g.39735  ORF Transcript_13157/g.39735 Transcript_13157/m.39735 type:complete len:266 (+) Transcript_13157:56-853(+)
MSLETAMVKANATDVHYQAFMSELLAVDEFGHEALPFPPSPQAAVDRLHRPGGEYLNMNPYYVLLLDPGCTIDEVKAQFRRMSLQVHPDKHGGDPRAGTAFEVVRKAYEKMDDASKLDLCNRICLGAQKRVDEKVKQARRALKKEGKPEVVPEDTPSVYRKVLRQFTSKMFVEFEQRRQQLHERDEREKKRKAEEAQLDAEAAKQRVKEERAWERSRQKRVAGWRAWSSNSARGLKKPPAVKAEGQDERKNNFEDRGVEWRRDWR